MEEVAVMFTRLETFTMCSNDNVLKSVIIWLYNSDLRKTKMMAWLTNYIKACVTKKNYPSFVLGE